MEWFDASKQHFWKPEVVELQSSIFLLFSPSADVQGVIGYQNCTFVELATFLVCSFEFGVLVGG